MHHILITSGLQDFALACKHIKLDQITHDPSLGAGAAAKFKNYILEGAWLTYCVAATARGHEPRELRLKDVCGFDLQPAHIAGDMLGCSWRVDMTLPAPPN